MKFGIQAAHDFFAFQNWQNEIAIGAFAIRHEGFEPVIEAKNS